MLLLYLLTVVGRYCILNPLTLAVYYRMTIILPSVYTCVVGCAEYISTNSKICLIVKIPTPEPTYGVYVLKLSKAVNWSGDWVGALR